MPRRSGGRERSGRKGARAPNAERVWVAAHRLTIQGNAWTYPFTRRHPRIVIQCVLMRDASPTTSVGDFWIRGDSARAWAEEIQALPDVVAATAISSLEGGTMYQVESVDIPEQLRYRQYHLQLPLPIWLQNGHMEWECAGVHAEAETMRRGIGVFDPAGRVISLRRRPVRSKLPSFSAAERRLFDRARAAGYYSAPPHHSSLGRVARRLRVNPAKLARELARIDAKILQSPMIHPESILRNFRRPKDVEGHEVPLFDRTATDLPPDR